MAKKEVAEKPESLSISDIAAELSTVQARRFLKLDVQDQPFTKEKIARQFGIQAVSVHNPLTILCDLGLLTMEKEEGKTGDARGSRNFYRLTELGIEVQELLQRREDLLPQLPPELGNVSLTDAQRDFFLKLDPNWRKLTISEITDRLGMHRRNVAALMMIVERKGLVERAGKRKKEEGGQKENLFKLSEGGVLYQAYLKTHPEGHELSPEERAKEWVTGNQNWFHRVIIATVGKQMPEGEEGEENALCLVQHISNVLVPKHGPYTELHGRVRTLVQAAAVADILIARNYDRAQDGNMPLHGEPNAWKHLENLLVVGIKQNRVDLVERVMNEEYGGFTKPEKTESKSEKSEQEQRLDELLVGSIRVDQPHETEEISSGASKILAFLQKKESGAFPRKALVRDFGGGAMGEIQELEDAGLVEVGAGGIVKVPSRR